MTNYSDHTTLYSLCDEASDLCQQRELVGDLEYDLRHTVDWGRKWPVTFNAGKTQLVSFEPSTHTCTIDVKSDGSVHEQTSFFKMLG